MRITRRQAVGGLGALGPGLWLGRVAPAWAQGAGKPFAGKEVKVLAVRSSQFAAHAKRAAAYEEQTGAKITYVDVPFPAMREKLTAEMVAGSTDFDLATIMDVWIPPMVEPYLLPLGKQIEKAGIDLGRYPKAFLQPAQFKGETYGLPTRCHIQLLYYRKDLFDKHGLTPPKTWEELVETGKAIQAKEDIAGVAIPYGKGNGQNLMVWYDFLWGAGGELFDEKMKPAFNSAKGLKATQDYVDLMLKHKITQTGAASAIEQDAVGSFVQGKAAMVPTWWHVYNRFKGKDSAITPEQVAFTTLPTYAGAEPSTYVNVWIYGANKKSRNLDATLDYLAWISRPEIERSILVDPAENDVVATQWTNLRDPEVNKRFNGMHQTAAEALAKTKTIPNIPEFLPVVDVLEVAMSNIATGQAGVADAMNAAASQVTRIMRRAG